jgi:hypothetical protein
MLFTDCVLNIASFLSSHIDILNVYSSSKSYLMELHRDDGSSSNDIWRFIYMGVLRARIDKASTVQVKRKFNYLLVQVKGGYDVKNNVDYRANVKRFILEYHRDKYVTQLQKITGIDVSTIDQFWKQWNLVDQLSYSLYEKFGELSISILRTTLFDSHSLLFVHMSNICNEQQQVENNLLFITQVFTNLISKWIENYKPGEISRYYDAVLRSRNEFIIDHIFKLISTTYPQYQPSSLLVSQCLSHNIPFSMLQKWIHEYGISELSDSNVTLLFQSNYQYENVKWLLNNMHHSKKLYNFDTFFKIATSPRITKTPQAKIELCALFLEKCGKTLPELQLAEPAIYKRMSKTPTSMQPSNLLMSNLHQAESIPSNLVFVQWLIDQKIYPYPWSRNRETAVMNAKEMFATSMKMAYPDLVRPFQHIGM